MALEFTTSHLKDATELFHYYKKLAERAMAQVPDEHLTTVLDGESNSIAHIVKHLAGNMLSRWTDFLTTDGEKPWRERDGEFVDGTQSREALMELWETGWKACFDALAALGEGDLTGTVTIRGEELTVTRAVLRNLTHAGYHVGQILILARHFAGDDWEVMTIPRGKSEEYNKQVWKK